MRPRVRRRLEEMIATYLDRLGLGAEAEPLVRTVVNRASAGCGAHAICPPRRAQAYNALAALTGRTSRAPQVRRTQTTRRFDPQIAFDTGNQVAGIDFAGGGILGRHSRPAAAALVLDDEEARSLDRRVRHARLRRQP